MGGLFCMLALSCGDSGQTTGTGSTTSSGTGMGGSGGHPATSSTQSGMGGMTGASTGTTTATSTSSSSSSGTGGTGGTGPVDHSASDLVNAGHEMSSSGFTLRFTMGQPTLDQAKQTSQNYHLRGGLTGATETLP